MLGTLKPAWLLVPLDYGAVCQLKLPGYALIAGHSANLVAESGELSHFMRVSGHDLSHKG